MFDESKEANAKAFSQLLPPELQGAINSVLEKARASKAESAKGPDPSSVIIAAWRTLVDRLLHLRFVQYLTAVVVAACIAVIFYALFNTDQGRDLLQLAQDKHSVTTLFIGISAITSFGVSLALKTVLADRPIDEYFGWGAMPALGIGLFAGFLYHSFLTFLLTFLCGGIGFVFFLVLDVLMWRSAKWTARLCFIVSALLLVLISYMPGLVGSKFGSPWIVIISVFAWVLMLYSLAVVGFLSGNPGNGLRMALTWAPVLWIAKCLLVAVYVSYRGYPILDYIREDRAKTVSGVPTLKLSLDNWKAKQPRIPGTKPRLVLVAAAGGGIRASYWTALSLARLVDQAPEFRNSLFASSGVSGGSLGLGVVYGLLANSKLDCRGSDQSIEPCVNAFHDNDFLAGPLGAIVAGYATNSILPFFPSRDDALEQSWERAWRRTVGTAIGAPDTFSSPMTDIWGQSAGHPLLLLNATSGRTGERVISADVDVEDVIHWRNACKLNLATLIPLQLSAAIGASARFPFVSELGWVRATSRNQCSPLEAVTDGGFFDNYGAATVFDLIDAIIATDGEVFKNYELVVIQITNDPSREMGCIFKTLNKGNPAAENYCAPRTVDESKNASWTPFARVFVKMNPILQLMHPDLNQTMERLPGVLWSAFFGTSGPSVVDVAMQAQTATGIDIAEKLRARVCGLGGAYYHLSTTGAGDIPLGWTLSETAQTKMSLLLSKGQPIQQHFDRLVDKLKGGNQAGQCDKSELYPPQAQAH